MENKIAGMLYGAALGDALGAPFEFKSGYPLEMYNGNLYLDIRIRTRWQGLKVAPIGSVTDDTCMTMALARSLIANNGFDEQAVVLSYEDFVNGLTRPKPLGFGKNTNLLFGGVKTFAGYAKRAQKIFDQGVSQSNGCLMRASPLSCVSLEEAVRDCNLTNPDPVCRDAVTIYWELLDKILKGKFDERKTSVYVAEKKLIPIVRAAVDGEEIDVDVKGEKGWVAFALYCGIYEFYHAKSFQEAVDHTILRGGDTDTNACVAGALVGAKFGLELMQSDPQVRKNIHRLIHNKERLEPDEKMVDAKSSGPTETVTNPQLDDIDEVIAGLTRLRLSM